MKGGYQSRGTQPSFLLGCIETVLTGDSIMWFTPLGVAIPRKSTLDRVHIKIQKSPCIWHPLPYFECTEQNAKCELTRFSWQCAKSYKSWTITSHDMRLQILNHYKSWHATTNLEPLQVTMFTSTIEEFTLYLLKATNVFWSPLHCT